MFKPAPRCLIRYGTTTVRAASPRRFFSTAPPAQRSRSWKNSAARWALALGGIYYYNTGSIFAEEPPLLPPSSPSDETSIPTLESIAAARQSRSLSPLESTSPTDALPESESPDQTEEVPESESLDEIEEEAGQQGAFNEETGEINWECPCLGGMAHGPCGEQFRAAFSCFVFSKAEPKGMDCIENFKTMQDCFRAHPDEYGGEFEDDNENPTPSSTPAPSSSPNPEVNEPSIPPPLPSSHPTPEVNEPSIPLLPYNASQRHPHVDEPSIDPPPRGEMASGGSVDAERSAEKSAEKTTEKRV